MYEFIVWDNLEEQFLDEENISINSFGTIFECCPDEDVFNTLSDSKESRFTIHKAIGKTDKNNKKIYADCSILRLNYFSSSDWISDVGCFVWDDENLRYEVHLENEREIVPFDPSCFDLMEIIDTLQENKLGLIK